MTDTVFTHTIRSRCRPVNTTHSVGVCPDCGHLRSGHNAGGECGICLSAKPYEGWKMKLGEIEGRNPYAR